MESKANWSFDIQFDESFRICHDISRGFCYYPISQTDNMTLPLNRKNLIQNEVETIPNYETFASNC